MRLLKSHPFLKLVNAYIIDHSQPSNISYLWNFGSLLGLCLVIQIVTGVTLAINGHYNPSIAEAFNSVEHIMRDVNNGWLIRYLHSNTASAFFFLVYLHIGRGFYYGSYRAPRTLAWVIGAIMLILMMGIGFLGYVLPYGQMSLWGSNPLGVAGYYDRIPFAPYYLFKDLITIFIFIFVLSIFVFFMPNVLGDSENYIMANPMQTPAAIALLPFYAILRSIPNKLLGVIAMFSSLIIILLLPKADLGLTKGLQFRPISKIMFYTFVINFLILMQLGAKHVESPYIELGQVSTILYFSYFLVIVPVSSIIENTLIEVERRSSREKK
uniref:Cytochrome b n=1 Tax=Ophiocordycipitaceae sp. TaxID=1907519 RepID=A0A7S8HP88_9HYPO|nr:cytochrome b [Ophiocordycipitaceae sp.]QUT09480.1 cytochrome b [Ophiocordycipitaceae sp.]QUT09508.1 cytochrome b [Ophiocordycipitaceae sp.]QUT13238.1 cytochrome b [Ophiocordycipitaceae sp.]DAJ12166.1 TPA_asm: cytochrome b [Ophiocordycipitaceae sp.]